MPTPTMQAISRRTRKHRALFSRVTGGIAVLALSFGAFFSAPAFAEETRDSLRAEETSARTIDSGEDADALSNAELAERRLMLYHRHVDAAHVAWDAEKSNFKIQVVDGATPKEADSVLVRLGPDATTDGREVSRIKLPSSNKLSFLGAPGSILWNAPAKFYQGWLPVWAGMGAGHDIPDHIDGEVIKLELMKVDGPGAATIWNGDMSEGGKAVLSSKDPSLFYILSEGGHGHFNWTFDKPGRYTFHFRASAKTIDGQTITSDPYQVIWLVGSDEELGLAPGTTSGNPIQIPAEDFDTGETDTRLGDGENTDVPVVSEEDNITAADPPMDGRYTCAVPGHYDLAVKIGDDRSVSAAVRDDHAKEYGAYELLIPVPDSAMRTLELNSYTRALSPLGAHGSKIWVLPEVQASHLPWLGFSTESVDYSDIDPHKGVRLYLDSFYGPGRMLTYDDDGINPIETVLDSRQVEYSYKFFEPTHRHTSMAFNKPGLYDLGFQYTAFFKPVEGKYDQDYAFNDVYYAVGNEEIDKFCPGWLEQYDVASPAAEANSKSTDKESEANPKSTDKESDTFDTGKAAANVPVAPPTLTENLPAEERHEEICEPVHITRPATDEEWRALQAGKNVARATLTFNVGDVASGNASNGHFDLGPVVEGGKLALKVKDDRGQVPRWVSPSSLSFALGASARMPAPPALSSIATQGTPIWLISSVQKPGVPWLGMNSQHPGLRGATTGPVTFTLEAVRGPGKVLMFESGSLGGGIGRSLFTRSGSSFTLPANTHAHYNWVFSQPGTYTMTISARVTPTAGSPLAASSGNVTLTGKRPMVDDVIGRTASGKNCVLPADVKARFAKYNGVKLARTGAQVQILVGFALLALSGGGYLVWATRRRSRSGLA